MKKTGTSTGGIEASPSYRRRKARRRRQEQAGWEAQSGPVLIRIGEHEIYAKSQAKRDVEAARKLLLEAIAGGTADQLPGAVRQGS